MMLCGLQRSAHLNVGVNVDIRVSGEGKHLPAGQGPSKITNEAFAGDAAHDERRAIGESLKPLHILWNMPWKAGITADTEIFVGHRCDDVHLVAIYMFSQYSSRISAELRPLNRGSWTGEIEN